VAPEGVRGWDSDLLRQALETSAAVARWTAVLVAWHAGAVGAQQTLYWHAEDLEAAPLEAAQALCRFLRLE
jgi:hypothetical protein